MPDGSGSLQPNFEQDSQSTADPADSVSATSAIQQVVIVDTSVADYQTLIAGIDPSVPIILLGPGERTLQGIAQALAPYSNLDIVTLVSEGGDGGIILGGNKVVTDGDLASNANDLAAIGASLKTGGDFQLLGCSIAADSTGQQFVDDFASALGNGVDVAASTDRTGPAALGGDWSLEYDSGASFNTVLPFTVAGMQNFDHCLGCTAVQKLDGWDYLYNNGQEIGAYSRNGSTPYVLFWNPGQTNVGWNAANIIYTTSLAAFLARTDVAACGSTNYAPVLDASKSPVLTSGSTSDTTLPTGIPVDSTLVSTLVSLSGGIANVSDSDSGATTGIAITAVDSTHGTWWYTINNGTTWIVVGSVSDSSALLLKADANTRLYFKSDGTATTNSTAITFRAWDTTTGVAGTKVTTATNGGSTAFSAATDTASLTVIGHNTAPTLTTTTSTPSFVEKGSAVSLFSGTAVGLGGTDTGQTIQGLTLTVGNLANGASEILLVDGFNVALTNGNNITTAANGYSVAVTLASGTATVIITKAGGIIPAQMQTLVNGLQYENTSDDPTIAGGRVVTLTAIQDSGGTANGGADTTTLSDVSTIQLAAVNDAPTLTTTPVTSITEGNLPASLFSGTAIDTVEAGQTIQSLTIAVGNVADGANEILIVDGTDVALTNGNITTATNNYNVNVALVGGTATVFVTKSGNLTPAQSQAAVNGLLYKNTSANPTVTGGRTVTLTAIQDSGGTANGGVDTTVLPATATVTLDSGPIVTAVTPSAVERSQTTVIGTVVPGLSGDTLTLTQTAGNGSIALQVVNGVTQVVYTAPALVSADTTDPVSYSITDQYGGAAAMGFASVPLVSAPVVLSDTSQPVSGVLNAGDTLSFILATSKPVFVNGIPLLTLSDGGTASYVAGSGTNALTFTTTIAAGQTAPSLAVTGVALPNGASIQDASGNNADLTGSAATFSGLAIDTTAPTIISEAVSPTSGTFGVGQTIQFTLELSEAVTVIGMPSLTLDDGGTATYIANDSTPTSLVFETTILPGQNAAALAITSAALNGASITDDAGNAIDFTNALASISGLQIDTIAPAVTIRLMQDTGNSNTDTITSNPTVTGGGDPNAAVTIAQNGADVATVTADANGIWSYTPTGLADGAQTMTATEADSAGNTATTTLHFVLDTIAPQAGAASLTVNPAAAATLIGLTMPTDGTNQPSDLSITVATLPTNGTITLGDGTTTVTTGQALTPAQLGEIEFKPNASAAGSSSTFTYTVGDAAGHVTTGSAALIVSPSTPVQISAAPTPVILLPSLATGGGTRKLISNIPTPTLAGTAQGGSVISIVLNGSAVGNTTAAADTGVYSVTLSTPLSSGADQLAATTDGASSTLDLFEISTPDQGTSTNNISSSVIGDLFSQGYGLQFVAGTEALTLVDGTLSVGQDTAEATLQRLYEGLLGRTNDSNGIGYWDALIAKGVSIASIADGFMASSEYQAGHAELTDTQYVNSLYTGLLSRDATSDELTYWTAALTQGTRGDVAVAIANSSEAKAALAGTTAQVWAPNANGTLVHEIYQTAFGREVEQTAGGLQYWNNQLSNGLTASDFVQAFVTTPEFTALHGGQSASDYVTSLYNDALGRAPEENALQYWTTQLQAGTMSQATVLQSIATSPEANSHLTRLL